MGEAELNLGNRPEAAEWYRHAAAVSRQRYGDLASSRMQARLLLQHWDQDSAWIDELLRVPKVAVFVGHMCDRPGRPKPRFPEELEEPVRKALRERLERHNALIGFSSVACGSDILFLETLLELHGEPHVVLPCNSDDFVRGSVDIIKESKRDWKARYEVVIKELAAADRKGSRVIQVAHGKMEVDSISYDYANQVLLGLGMQRAKELDTELIGLAVWDGQAGDGLGGTETVVTRWRRLGLQVDCIDMERMLRDHCSQSPGPVVAGTAAVLTPAPASSRETKVLALLFADAVGFSTFTEAQAVNFTRHCLSAICRALLDWPHEALVRESRGDGVYLAFETVRETGLFALHIRDLMEATDWTTTGLPADLRLRIGLHAGPVCRCFDPILGAQTWTGTHVSRAARIEPMALPGQVYASQQFAALAAVEQVTEFSCVYVGTEKLPKGYGTFPLYVVRRR